MIRRHRFLVLALGIAPLFACALAAAGDFVDLRRIKAVHGDAAAGEAKATVCHACHGAEGIAAGTVFPNLAGQQVEYLYRQLVEFKQEARPDSPMTPMVANLDDAAMRDLAAYFASLPAAPSKAPADAASRGARLFREGDPATGTPPCQGCHGADGGGHPWAEKDAQYRVYPRLRGQHADYVVQRLKDFHDGKHLTSSSDRIMAPIARTLDEASMKAVAAWIESGL
jgi:cytochrome c553